MSRALFDNGNNIGKELTYDTDDGIWDLKAHYDFVSANPPTTFYSHTATFTSGTGLGSSDVSAFTTIFTDFKAAGASVTGLYLFFGAATSGTFSETNYTYAITNTTHITAYQNALGGSTGVGSGTTSYWYLGFNCGSTTGGYTNSPSFHLGLTQSCQCDSGTPVFRPFIGAVNGNWGGYGGGCSQGTQVMGLGYLA